MPAKKSPETSSGLKNTKKLFCDSDSDAKTKKKGKPRGKPFETGNRIGKTFVEGDDPRRHTGSRYNKDLETVRKEYTQIFVAKVSEEIVDENGVRMRKMDKIVDETIKLAMAGEKWASLEIFNRVCGKSPQTIDLKSPINPLNDSLKIADRDKEVRAIIEAEIKEREKSGNAG